MRPIRAFRAAPPFGQKIYFVQSRVHVILNDEIGDVAVIFSGLQALLAHLCLRIHVYVMPPMVALRAVLELHLLHLLHISVKFIIMQLYY